MWHQGFGMAPMMGFGFGFLNFIGTILFFVFLFALLRMFFRGWRYAGMGRGPRGGSGGPWMARGMGHGWGRHGWGSMLGGLNSRDEALETARERLAKSEITPEQFETIRKGLETRRQRDDDEQPWRGWTGKDEALETARLRFARGEISAEEFEMIKRALES